jgi:hypothetical protein
MFLEAQEKVSRSPSRLKAENMWQESQPSDRQAGCDHRRWATSDKLVVCGIYMEALAGDPPCVTRPSRHFPYRDAEYAALYRNNT